MIDSGDLFKLQTKRDMYARGQCVVQVRAIDGAEDEAVCSVVVSDGENIPQKGEQLRIELVSLNGYLWESIGEEDVNTAIL